MARRRANKTRKTEYWLHVEGHTVSRLLLCEAWLNFSLAHWIWEVSYPTGAADTLLDNTDVSSIDKSGRYRETWAGWVRLAERLRNWTGRFGESCQLSFVYSVYNLHTHECLTNKNNLWPKVHCLNWTIALRRASGLGGPHQPNPARQGRSSKASFIFRLLVGHKLAYTLLFSLSLSNKQNNSISTRHSSS